MRRLMMSRLIRVNNVSHFVLSTDHDPYREQWFWPGSKMGESTSETRGWNGEISFELQQVLPSLFSYSSTGPTSNFWTESRRHLRT